MCAWPGPGGPSRVRKNAGIKLVRGGYLDARRASDVMFRSNLIRRSFKTSDELKRSQCTNFRAIGSSEAPAGTRFLGPFLGVPKMTTNVRYV
jgi:hypothetical protein